MARYIALSPHIAGFGIYKYEEVPEHAAIEWIKHHHKQHKEHGHPFETAFNNPANQAVCNHLGEMTGLYIPLGSKPTLPLLNVGDEALIVTFPSHQGQGFGGGRPQQPVKFGMLKSIE